MRLLFPTTSYSLSSATNCIFRSTSSKRSFHRCWSNKSFISSSSLSSCSRQQPMVTNMSILKDHHLFYFNVKNQQHNKRLFTATTTVTNSSSSPIPDGPVALDMEQLQLKIEELAPTIASDLESKGYYSSDDPTFTNLFDDNPTTAKYILSTLRKQSIALRNDNRYEQSWSESIDSSTGKITKFDKPGVFACEPDGQDYDLAPDLVSYMSILITTLPQALNRYLSDDVAKISDNAFNAKLAVTCPNSEYPLHVDNSVGVQGGDTRKLTCILYMNPNYYTSSNSNNNENKGGELRLHLLDDKQVNIQPNVWLLFWTDEIPHKVLKTTADAQDRYALTVWLADDDPISHIHNPKSKFAQLRFDAF